MRKKLHPRASRAPIRIRQRCSTIYLRRLIQPSACLLSAPEKESARANPDHASASDPIQYDLHLHASSNFLLAQNAQSLPPFLTFSPSTHRDIHHLPPKRLHHPVPSTRGLRFVTLVRACTSQ